MGVPTQAHSSNSNRWIKETRNEDTPDIENGSSVPTSIVIGTTRHTGALYDGFRVDPYDRTVRLYIIQNYLKPYLFIYLFTVFNLFG